MKRQRNPRKGPKRGGKCLKPPPPAVPRRTYPPTTRASLLAPLGSMVESFGHIEAPIDSFAEEEHHQDHRTP